MKTLMIVIQLISYPSQNVVIESKVVDMNDCLISQNSVTTNEVSIECIPLSALG
jgi:hypothetical protein